MKKAVCILLVLLLTLGGTALADTYKAEAQGFGGAVSVSVTVEAARLPRSTSSATRRRRRSAASLWTRWTTRFSRRRPRQLKASPARR